MSQIDQYQERALKVIRHLSVIIGGRGSCTPPERAAAEFTVKQMHELGVSDVRLEPYRGASSTYYPYAMAFGAAAASTLLAWLLESPWTAGLAALINALGFLGMLAETDFATSWMRVLLPKGDSHNAVGVIAPAGEVRQRVVLCAHLDTHRTPIFYSSKRWHRAFTALVTLTFLSLFIGAIAYALLALWAWEPGLWIGAFTALAQVVFLDLCVHAESTPFSPGANDDASGVGVVLALAQRLREESLSHTEVWLAFTGCEETGAYGMSSFLDTHAAELGKDAVIIVLDQVGSGQVTYLTADGLIIKRKTHPRALQLARAASSALPDLQIQEQVGIAYTDAAVATKRGHVALTVVTLPPANSQQSTNWHQMSDTLDRVDPRALSDTITFTRAVLSSIDINA